MLSMSGLLRLGQVIFVTCIGVGMQAKGSFAACPEPVKYTAVIDEADLVSSSGTKLTTSGAVVRQDRANFHKFSRRDPGDQSDDVLFDPKKRAALERAVNEFVARESKKYGGADVDYDDLLEELLQGGLGGTYVTITFWHCDERPRAIVENVRLVIPHSDEPPGKLEPLAPPPK
ncbi:MAG: hypothetical protein C0511_05410 [Hyphomicrobium sp.]|nr:hypothetical protein [Hyphomicrobium sp.]